MNFADFSNELLEQIRGAKSKEEIEGFIKNAGASCTPADIDTFWAKVSGKVVGTSDLSEDELDAVSGGADRDLVNQECAATVENGSWCWTNDACSVAQVTYDNWWAICDKSPYKRHKWVVPKDDDGSRIRRCEFCGKGLDIATG